jgi:hypothetical protein
MKYKEFSANTVTFICCRSTLTIKLAGAARGEKGSKDGGGLLRILRDYQD